MTPVLLVFLAALIAAVFFLGRRRALSAAGGDLRALHSLPVHYGLYAALWCGLPALMVLALGRALETPVATHLTAAELADAFPERDAGGLDLLLNNIKNIAEGAAAAGNADPRLAEAAARYRALRAAGETMLFAFVAVVAAAGGAFGLARIRPDRRARNGVEAVLKGWLALSSSIAVLTTIGIVLSVIFESLRFFNQVPVSDFLFGLTWSPQTAIRADQVGGSGTFGAVPLFVGTLLISAIAMAVAVPVGLMSAIYLSEYASPPFRAIAKPLLEILAGIPTVVYGFFAAIFVAPLIRDMGGKLGLDVSSESALAAGLVMGIMIIPFVSSISDDVINAVPQALRDGAYGLGATQAETIQRVVLPAALPGIVSGILLAVSRAIGETMIVVMAAGLSAKLTVNPLEAVTTMTVQIVMLLTGDQEFDSAKTLAAFALGLLLFTVTLVFNIIALYVVRRYREAYE